EDRLEQRPRDPEDGLLVADEDVALREDEQQLAVAPELAEVEADPAVPRLDHLHGAVRRVGVVGQRHLDAVAGAFAASWLKMSSRDTDTSHSGKSDRKRE